MAKKMTLEQRAAVYARGLKAMTIAWRDGAEDGFKAGWRACGRADAATEAERAVIEAAKECALNMLEGKATLTASLRELARTVTNLNVERSAK
jgi:hypothetical protein